MTNNEWMHKSNMQIRKGADLLRNQSTSGIISGLDVQRVENTLSLRVLPGSAVISGVFCELTYIEDGLIPAIIQDGSEVFVVMTCYQTTTSVQNRYDETTEASRSYAYKFDVVPVHDFIPNAMSCVLAHCRYSFTPRITSIPGNAGIQLPARFFGVYDSLSTVNANTDFLDNLMSNDSIAVRSVSTTPGLVGTDVLELYYWLPRSEPVTITVVNPETSATEVVQAIWGPRDVDAGDLTAVLRYWLPSISDPTGQHLWTSDYRTHDWVLGNANEHGITPAIMADFIGIDVDISNDVRRYGFMRPTFSGVDTWHRAQSRLLNISEQNPHGLGFNDIGYDVMPLHKQMFNAGFGIAPMEKQGIVGTFVEEIVDNVNVRTDYFGDITNVMLNKFIRTKHVPMSVAYLYETTTGNNIPYELKNDVVDLGKSFVGGDLEHYPEFYNTNAYNTGDRVIRHVNSITHLYECTTPWPAGHVGPASDKFDPSYFNELTRTDVVVGYFFIADFEYTSSSDNSVYVQTNTTTAVVSEGLVIEPSADGQLSYSLSGLKDVPVQKLILSVSAENKLVASNTGIDRARLETKKSSTTQKTLTSPSQIKAYVVNAPDVYDIAPPEGQLVVTSTNFYGTYKLFYTYGVLERQVFTTTSRSQSYSGDINLASAQLLEGVNYIPRDSWEYSANDNQVIIASDVYIPSRTYTLRRYASETQRNRRGYITATGTNAKPEGVKARASLIITDYNRLDLGDTISLTIPGVANTVVKTLQASAGYTGFVKGASIAETKASIQAAFNTDPICIANNVMVDISGANIEFVAGKAGIDGNAYTLTVQSINTSMIANAFENGSDHQDSLLDIYGLQFEIRDTQTVDIDGYYSIWAVMDSSGSNQYKRIAVVPASTTGITTGIISATTQPSVQDTYDLGQEFALSLQITGTDSEDNEVQETLVFDFASFCCIPNHRVLNPYSHVRSANYFKTITGWTVMDSANVGSSSLILVAESASGTKDLFDVCSVNWTGARIKTLKDARRFVDAVTNKPSADILSEALSSTAAILQLQ